MLSHNCEYMDIFSFLGMFDLTINKMLQNRLTGVLALVLGEQFSFILTTHWVSVVTLLIKEVALHLVCWLNVEPDGGY